MTEPPAFRCPRCAADPQPANFANARKCAFTAAGAFTPDNWNCATFNALMARVTDEDEHTGDNESLQLIPVRVPETDDEDDWAMSHGWIVLTRYKQRGRTSSAIHVGDFWPARPVTYALVAQVLDQHEAVYGP